MRLTYAGDIKDQTITVFQELQRGRHLAFDDVTCFYWVAHVFWENCKCGRQTGQLQHARPAQTCKLTVHVVESEASHTSVNARQVDCLAMIRLELSSCCLIRCKWYALVCTWLINIHNIPLLLLNIVRWLNTMNIHLHMVMGTCLWYLTSLRILFASNKPATTELWPINDVTWWDWPLGSGGGRSAVLRERLRQLHHVSHSLSCLLW